MSSKKYTGDRVGFFRFLKRGKKADNKLDDSLDIPPPPPSMDMPNPAKDMPGFELKQDKTLEAPSIKFGDNSKIPKDNELDMPSFPPINENDIPNQMKQSSTPKKTFPKKDFSGLDQGAPSPKNDFQTIEDNVSYSSMNQKSVSQFPKKDFTPIEDNSFMNQTKERQRDIKDNFPELDEDFSEPKKEIPDFPPIQEKPPFNRTKFSQREELPNNIQNPLFGYPRPEVRQRQILTKQRMPDKRQPKQKSFSIPEKPKRRSSFFDEEKERDIYMDVKHKMERGPDFEGPLYIRIDKYRNTIGGVNSAKSDFQKANELLDNIIQSKEDKDKALENWRETMMDIQNKLIFVEKALFKG